MFRTLGSFSQLNGVARRQALAIGSRSGTQAIAFRQHQRTPFSSKNDRKDDPPPPKQPIDYEAERKIGERKLEARPSEVSAKSSTTNELKTPVQNKADNPILQNELRHDMGIIKDTFSLDNVPRESKILGLAGTLPYLATSLSTLYLGWDLKQTLPTGNWLKDALVIDHETAQYLISVMEPIQLGYGAVIISFLGAIHWGLEYAEKRPHPERTRFRYGMGLASSIIAWPTLIMPVPYALTTQFAAFVGLYFADARATTRGWAPQWYGSYRFMLTAMVGLALFVSLIGRQKMIQGDTLTLEGLQTRLEQTGRVDHNTDWAKLEAEEKERLRKEKAEAEKKAKQEEKEKKKKGKDAKDTRDAKEGEDGKSDGKSEGSKAGDSDNKHGQQNHTDEEEDSDEKSGDNENDDENSGNDGEDESDTDKEGDNEEGSKGGDVTADDDGKGGEEGNADAKEEKGKGGQKGRKKSKEDKQEKKPGDQDGKKEYSGDDKAKKESGKKGGKKKD